MGVPLVSKPFRLMRFVLPTLLAGSGVALLVTGAAPASAAAHTPGVQICLLKTACVTAGQAPSTSPSPTPLIAITIGGSPTLPAVPALPSSIVTTSLPVAVPTANVSVSVPSVEVTVHPASEPTASPAEHAAGEPQASTQAPAEGSDAPSVVASFGTVNGAASASVAVVAPPSATATPGPSSRVGAARSGIVPVANPHALQAVAPTAIRPVAVSPKLIRHIVSHSIGGVLLLTAACLVFIGVEISADRRDPKLVRAAQKSEWLRFEDPGKASGGVA